MNLLNTVYLNDSKTAYTPAEVASVLPAVVDREALVMLVALRVSGFSEVEAGAASLHAVEGSPEALAAVVTAFESHAEFAAILNEVVETIGMKNIRAAWHARRVAAAMPVKQAVLSFSHEIVECAARPFSTFKAERHAQALAELQKAKREQANDNRRRDARDNASLRNFIRSPQQ